MQDLGIGFVWYFGWDYTLLSVVLCIGTVWVGTGILLSIYIPHNMRKTSLINHPPLYRHANSTLKIILAGKYKK